MWSGSSHSLQMLTSLTYMKLKSKLTDAKKVWWHQPHHSQRCIILLPWFKEVLDTRTDANNIQLRELVIQCVNPINLYSSKWTGYKLRYTTIKNNYLV